MQLRDDLRLHARSAGSIWTDAHIAQGMLAAHLDLETNAASRKLRTVRQTVDWIVRACAGRSRLADLGCGPGIYANLFHDAGFAVTGIDVSQNSIAYASAWARRTGRDITYVCKDYVRDDLGGPYDAAVCIYCDFGALIPAERDAFVRNVHGALARDGVFVFDCLGPAFRDTLREGRRWSYEADASFWSPRPHFLLEEEVHFPQARAWGRRAIVIEEHAAPREFITWDHYFEPEDLRSILQGRGFIVERIERAGTVVDDDEVVREDVLFVEARKR